ncbi:hypothetical protein PDIP_20440 [Penicillium digitatum Pd1]|uniref:Clavaminate synthase-like protein n=1 Tax=Penicillium digitatum (strain Pd1 / CECT 20795) TaxID=1170230 RepID=K9GGA9_PEND1|nr:hypothetical protein PDIP_20440 [Penicillium digitatum Pd1]EKV20019.1 hypothetical protein PDIP_20440 [Penicillium digitatum Pd1]
MASNTMAEAVTVSLQELVDGSVSFDTLTKAFGPSSLGIIVVKDLPSTFNDLRKKVLSNASYLAALPGPELDSLTSPESKYLVGWSCGKETLKSGHFDTLKGSYYVNCAFYQDASLDSAPADGFPDLPQYTAPNIWPSPTKLPEFRGSLESLCGLIIDTAALVAKACDRYAEANIEGYKPGYLHHEDEAETEVSDDDWCATHLDHGCLTGLTSAMFLDEAASPPTLDPSSGSASAPLPELPHSPDPSAGLYIRSRTDEIVKVNIPRDCLAFQTGEALQLITRGKFMAVPHFVKGAKNSPGQKVARNTLAVFTQPNLAEEVQPGLSFAEFARGVVQKNY